MRSEALLIARNRDIVSRPEVVAIMKRLEGIILARKYAMIEYDIPRQALAEACAVTPGIESPTVSPLTNDQWAAVKAMTLRRDLNSVIDRLEAIGAKGIIVTDIRTCRI